MSELLLIGLAPLVEQVTQSVKRIGSLRPFASLISLIVGYLLVLIFTQDLKTTLLVGSALGGSASAFHKIKKYVDQIELGEPELVSADME